MTSSKRIFVLSLVSSEPELKPPTVSVCRPALTGPMSTTTVCHPDFVAARHPDGIVPGSDAAQMAVDRDHDEAEVVALRGAVMPDPDAEGQDEQLLFLKREARLPATRGAGIVVAAELDRKRAPFPTAGRLARSVGAPERVVGILESLAAHREPPSLAHVALV